ncbi:hydroxyacid dehydrogenase [Rubrobacter taiwanensis]|uniref:Hydroxyacid dehydrogenase n=1 Tax=Rubrobacter taiwanensis TaxID=185139 RepID=A0A4R1BRY8_9ACTN|nr:NAD(P)-dependent oxidoreductase [Rubrobacter taiwanensis]TCJ19985.1 hydroxyacid dehydrogenase [Rubrobacter taiwanensis]
MTHLVYVQRPIHEEAIELLRSSTKVVLGFGPGGRDIEAILPDVHAILVRTDPLPAELIRRARSLRVIARHGVGVDNIALDEANRRCIPVLITPEANLRSVAEHVFALALAASRNLMRADSFVRTGRFAERDRLAGRELFGGRIGVIGIGRIGAEVVRIARGGFAMQALGYDPHLTPEEIRQQGAEPTENLDKLLSTSDIVTVHVPLTPKTRGLLGARELSLMRPESVLVQTSRGGVIDEATLAAAMREGRLAGAGVDVFEQEPPPEDHPFFGMNSMVLTPHIGAHTRQAMRRMAMAAARGILDVLSGVDPFGPDRPGIWQPVNNQLSSSIRQRKGVKQCR